MGLIRSWGTSIFVLASLAGAGTALAQEPDPVEESGCTRLVDFDPGRFGPNSNVVSNRFLPLLPGMQRVFEGRSAATGEDLAHRVTFTVTGLTKTVDGVRTAVVWDVDESEDVVTEAELAVFAQDRAGNVWNLGEYPEEYPGGFFRGAPNTWFAGLADAEPGIHMPARPQTSLPEYVQGSVPSIEFLDCGKVVEATATRVVVHERSPLDPDGGLQTKTHQRDRGIVEIGAIGDPEAETLTMTEFRRLSPAELRAANREARILDQRGHQCDQLYAQTEPLEGPGDGDFGPYTCSVPPPVVGLPPITFTFPSPPPAPPPPTAPAGPAPETPAAPRYVARVRASRFPLARLRSLLYEGREGGVAVRVRSRVRARRVRVTGARATAVESRRWEAGRLVERSTAYYAQDRSGNVWQLGQRVDRIRNGRVAGHDGRWIAGRRGARRALVVPADPEVGQRFASARAPGAARQRSTVVSVNVAETIPAGRFTGCLHRRDRDLRRGGATKITVFCPDIGLAGVRSRDGAVVLVRFRRAGG